MSNESNTQAGSVKAIEDAVKHCCNSCVVIGFACVVCTFFSSVLIFMRMDPACFWAVCVIGLMFFECELMPRSLKILSSDKRKKRRSAFFQPAFMFSGFARNSLTAAFRLSEFRKSILFSSNICRQKSRDICDLFIVGRS